MKKLTKLLALPLIGMMIAGCAPKEQGPQPSVTVSDTTVVLLVGGTKTLTATLENTEGTVSWASSDTSVATVDANGVVTAVAKGNVTITATCNGASASCSLRVKDATDFRLVSVQENENIKDFKNNVSGTEFIGTHEAVIEVGDDNAFDVKPQIKILDVETLEEGPESIWQYDYEVSLQKHDGSAYVAAPEGSAEIDAKNAKVDFNEAAIGGKFKITVRPGGLTDEQKASAEFKKEIEVKVCNGYNVYSANELAYFNDVNFLDDDRQSQFEGNGQINNAWKSFRTGHGLHETYVAPGIYLQKSIELQASNLPGLFFYTSAEVGSHTEWVGKMKDASDLYCHYADGFTFSGNFFHIDTQKLPLAVDNLGYDDNVSHSTLFKVAYRGKLDTPTIKEMTFKNCSYFGNAPRDDEEEHAMGLIFFKVRNAEYDNNVVAQATFDTFNVKAACISFFGEVGDNKIIVKNSKVTEGYSNGFYFWNNGDLDVQNSLFRNFGGPVIITDGSADNTHTGFHITVDEATVLDNWVTGDEPWFAHTKGGGPKAAIPRIQTADACLNAFGKTFLQGSEKFMNFIIINYGAIPFMTFKKGSGSKIGFDKLDENAAKYQGDLYAEGESIFLTDNGSRVNTLGSDVVEFTGELGGNWLDLLQFNNAFGFLSLVFELKDLAS